jgi:hypothetical protein
VTNIGDFAFYNSGLTNAVLDSGVSNLPDETFQCCSDLLYITIPASITPDSIYAVGGCTSLRGAFFSGDAPGSNVVYFAQGAVLYYLPGSSGWTSNYFGHACLEWNPSTSSVAVQNGQFGFDLTGTTNIPVMVEVCDDLSAPLWTGLKSGILTGGFFHFTDPEWTNYQSRFYRISPP